MEVLQNNIWTVYVHIVPKDIRNSNNNKYYVGITKQEPERRWQNGYGYKGQYFYKAIQKYGWDNIEHKIVAKDLTEKEAKSMEKALIDELNTRNHDFGYNCTDGGDGCVNLSKEARKKISNAQKNKIVSKETRKKIQVANSRTIYQFNLDGSFIREWEGTYKIKQELGYCNVPITSCCLHKSNQAYGFLWSYDKNDDRVYQNLRVKSVQQYDYQGNFVKEYKSISEAEKQTGISGSNISSCCNKKIKSAGKYQWKFADDDSYIGELTFNYKTKKVRNLTLDGSFVSEFNSTCEASRITGVNQQHISNVCLGKRKTAGGYKWEFVNDNFDMQENKAQTDAKQKSVTAQAEQDAAKIKAETKLIEAQAEKEANELLNQSLSNEVLEKLWIERWNGVVPQYYGGSGTDLIFNTGTTE